MFGNVEQPRAIVEMLSKSVASDSFDPDMNTNLISIVKNIKSKNMDWRAQDTAEK